MPHLRQLGNKKPAESHNALPTSLIGSKRWLGRDQALKQLFACFEVVWQG